VKAKGEGGVKPPHSKALRAFSSTVVSRKIMKSALKAAKSFLPLSLAPGDCAEAIPGLEREFASNSDPKLRRVLGLSLARCSIGAGKETVEG
jgi:hypothetical protein